MDKKYIQQRRTDRQLSKRLKLLADDADIDQILSREEELQGLPGCSTSGPVVLEVPESDPYNSPVQEISCSASEDGSVLSSHRQQNSSPSGIDCESFPLPEEIISEEENACAMESRDEHGDEEHSIHESDKEGDDDNNSISSNVGSDEVTDFDHDWRGLDESDVDNVDPEWEIPGIHVNVNDDSFQPELLDLSELYTLLEECRQDDAKPDDQLQKELALWTLRHNVKHEAVNDLLRILRDNNHPSLPCSSKTLMKTPRSTQASIKAVGGGTFWYHGILKAMAPYLTEELLDGKTIIVVDIFMDGVSPYRSVRRSLWPIVGCIVGDTNIFIIAMWCGNSKEPKDLKGYLEDFVSEAKQLMLGFTFNGKNYKLEIRRYIADAPARAWLKNVRSHTSYNSCERCNLPGQWKGRITYHGSTIGQLRTDETFDRRLHHEHHLGKSPLEELGTKMISQLPLEGMHMVHLGVMKRILQMLCSKKKASIHTVTENKLEILSSYLQSFAPCCPSDFPRKPRALSEWKLYKATELRRLLLYDGILLFKEFDKEVYSNFLLFHCTIRILSDPRMREFYDDADYLLKKFVEHAGSSKVYGPTFIVFNVHNLLHFAYECKCHGCLEDFSAYKYENFLGCLKNYLHAPGRTLAQIVARIMEKERQLVVPKVKDTKGFSLLHPHSSGPTVDLNGQQFRKVNCSGMMFRLSLGDSCCLMKNGDIVEIRNFVQTQNGVIWIVGQKYYKKENFYTYPVDSSTLGIFKVSGLCHLSKWRLQDVEKKLMRLPISTKHPTDLFKRVKTSYKVCIPLIHDYKCS